MNFQKWPIDQSWTLFLDRDGVINRRIVGGYVSRWEDFQLLEGVQEAMAVFTRKFGHIIVVSNQQGVGKGLLTINQVEKIHEKMIEEVRLGGGRIDRVFFSPYLSEEKHPDRKPGTGMAFKARKDFPGISFDKSIMVGDSLSDMMFGKQLGMIKVLITDEYTEEEAMQMADFNFPGLYQFSLALK